MQKMLRAVLLLFLVVMLTSCTEQGNASDKSESATSELTSISTPLITTENSAPEAGEVEINDPLSGLVPITREPLYACDFADVPAAEIPADNLDGSTADLALIELYDEAAKRIQWFFALAPLDADSEIIYNGAHYFSTFSEIETMSALVTNLSDYLTGDYIHELFGVSKQTPPFVEYSGRLYALDGAYGDISFTDDPPVFYRVSMSDTQAIYEAYYKYDNAASDFEGFQRRYVVLEKQENGHWLIADGAFHSGFISNAIRQVRGLIE